MHVVIPIDLREQIRTACEQHDRMMAEHAAERERAASPDVRETEPDGLQYRTHQNNAPASAATTETAPAGEDEARLFDDPDLNERFAQTMGYLISELRHEWKQEIDRRISALQGENAEIRGMLTSALVMLGGDKAVRVPQKGDDDSVVELPRFLRRTHAA
jgi:hypothetical protein